MLSYVHIKHKIGKTCTLNALMEMFPTYLGKNQALTEENENFLFVNIVKAEYCCAHKKKKKKLTFVGPTFIAFSTEVEPFTKGFNLVLYVITGENSHTHTHHTHLNPQR